MDITSTINGHIDFAQILLYVFWLFFAGLIIYLQRENMREGYPLEQDDGTEAPNQGPFPLPSKKTFKMPFGRDDITVPVPNDGDQREIALRQSSPSNGSPFIPTGNPMIDGVGPASWAERRDVPELDGHGHNKIAPMGASEMAFKITGGRDPRGLPVEAADGEIVGTVTELWIDQPEQLIRYLEIDVEGAGSRLAPMQLLRIRKDRVKIRAISGAQFADVPTIATPTAVTMLEEDKICGYYAGGKLYAVPSRIGPLLDLAPAKE
jgi:photosynthetic reaction center H subunit